VGGRPYAFTAKRYPFTVTRIRRGFVHEKGAAALIERDAEGCEEVVVYGYGNAYGNEGNVGASLVRLWLTGSGVADVSQWNGDAPPGRPARAI